MAPSWVFVSILTTLCSAAPPGSRPSTAPRSVTQARPAPSRPVDQPASASRTAPSTPKLADGVLWDHWYTVTVGGKIKYSYYSEKVRRTEGRIHYQYSNWKSEEGYINEESLGAYAKDTPFLEPILFNFRSTYRSSETTIDGTIQPGNKLIVKIRRNGTEIAPINRMIEPKAMLSGFFPVWFKLRLPLMKVSQTIGFRAIAEDNIDLNFQPFNGLVRLEPPDELAARSKLHRLTVNYRDIRSTWYLDAKGIPFRIDMPGVKTVIQRVSEAEAKKFLD